MTDRSSIGQRLAGKVALVTGGSRGIGAAIVKRLAQEGAKVAFSYVASADAANRLVEEVKREGGNAVAFRADAASAHESAELVRRTVAHFGGLDILVNNAGVFILKPVQEITDEEYDRLFDVNVRGVFAAVREAANHLSDGGRIITIGSVSGERAHFYGGALYSATKFAVQGLTRGWARELAPRNITVNVVQPGPIDTDMNPANSEFAEELRKTVPLNRYGFTDEVANTVAFLASPEASYISAAAINVDGGLEA